MTRFIRKYVDSCMQCSYGKGNHGKSEGLLHPLEKPTTPMHTVHIDHVGPFPRSKRRHSYVLTIVDSFTKFMIARPTRTLGSSECIEILQDVFGSFMGYPRRIISDNGRAFTSCHFKEFVNERQINHVKTAVCTPRANGQIERYHRTLLNSLRTLVDNDSVYWDAKLPDAIWGMNNTVNSSTKFSPHELMFNHKSRLLSDLEVSEGDNLSNEKKREMATRNLQKVAESMKKIYDRKKKKPKVYKKGDLVLWKDGTSGGVKGVGNKLNSKYVGPYLVTKAFGNDRYKIRSIKGMKGYKAFSTMAAVDSLRPFHGTVIQSSCSSSDSEDEIRDRDDLIDLLES